MVEKEAKHPRLVRMFTRSLLDSEGRAKALAHMTCCIGDPMTIAFDHRISEAWSESQWILDEMFDNGMCFFEGYVLAVDLTALESPFSRLTGDTSSIDFSSSVWAESTSEVDWDRTYPLEDYVKLFQSGQILMLQADYVCDCAG